MRCSAKSWAIVSLKNRLLFVTLDSDVQFVRVFSPLCCYISSGSVVWAVVGGSVGFASVGDLHDDAALPGVEDMESKTESAVFGALVVDARRI
jgi:hypothetical protein